MYRVILTRKSLDDLERIEDFITLKSSAAIAQRYVSSIRRFLRDAADSTSPRRTARPSEEGTSQHRFQEAGLHLLSGIRFQEDGQHRPNLVRGLSRQKRMKYSARSQIRVAHPFAHFAKGWGIARSATALLWISAALASAQVSASPCALTSVHDTVVLSYPPIARAAHVEGSVEILATFAANGDVTNVQPISGPAMLQKPSGNYVQGWKTNASEASRDCVVTVTYHLVDPTFSDGCTAIYPPRQIARFDIQHVAITDAAGGECDPMVVISVVLHHFLFFHWKTKLKVTDLAAISKV